MRFALAECPRRTLFSCRHAVNRVNYYPVHDEPSAGRGFMWFSNSLRESSSAEPFSPEGGNHLGGGPRILMPGTLIRGRVAEPLGSMSSLGAGFAGFFIPGMASIFLLRHLACGGSGFLVGGLGLGRYVLHVMLHRNGAGKAGKENENKCGGELMFHDDIDHGLGTTETTRNMPASMW